MNTNIEDIKKYLKDYIRMINEPQFNRKIELKQELDKRKTEFHMKSEGDVWFINGYVFRANRTELSKLKSFTLIE